MDTLLNQCLIDMGVDEIIYIDDDNYYLINISWLHWNTRSGSSEEKEKLLEQELQLVLPAGAEWYTI